MTRKIKPIVRGKIVVWPLIPRLAAGVKLHNQSGAACDPNLNNVVVLPVTSIAPAAVR